MKAPARPKGEPRSAQREAAATNASAAGRRAPRSGSAGVRRGAPKAAWREGWWSPAERCASPNFGPRPAGARVDLAVIHSISLPPGRYGGDAIERLFTNTLDWDAHPYYAQMRGLQVSAHFLVRRDGRVLQFVSCDQRAWHAGVSSWQGRDNCNDYSVGIELEGLEGESFEDAQYTALVELLRALAAHYPIDAVVGHEHIAAGRKRDPGAGFNWQQVVSALAWPAHRFAPGLGAPAG